jgi:hypothetical protein
VAAGVLWLRLARRNGDAEAANLRLLVLATPALAVLGLLLAAWPARTWGPMLLQALLAAVALAGGAWFLLRHDAMGEILGRALARRYTRS